MDKILGAIVKKIASKRERDIGELRIKYSRNELICLLQNNGGEILNRCDENGDIVFKNKSLVGDKIILVLTPQASSANDLIIRAYYSNIDLSLGQINEFNRLIAEPKIFKENLGTIVIQDHLSLTAGVSEEQVVTFIGKFSVYLLMFLSCCAGLDEEDDAE